MTAVDDLEYLWAAVAEQNVRRVLNSLNAVSHLRVHAVAKQLLLEKAPSFCASLVHAIESSDCELLACLLARKADVSVASAGQACLRAYTRTACRDNRACLNLLLDAGLDLTQQPECELLDMPLWHAAQTCNVALVEQLLRLGLPVDAKSVAGETVLSALYVAPLHVPICQTLLRHKADVSALRERCAGRFFQRALCRSMRAPRPAGARCWAPSTAATSRTQSFC